MMPGMEEFEFTAELWEHSGPGSWHFVTVPFEVSEDIREVSGPPGGFGSVRVEVRVGSSTWLTSVFPDKSSGCFVLPVKKQVRAAEALEAGDELALVLGVVGGDGA